MIKQATVAVTSGLLFQLTLLEVQILRDIYDALKASHMHQKERSFTTQRKEVSSLLETYAAGIVIDVKDAEVRRLTQPLIKTLVEMPGYSGPQQSLAKETMTSTYSRDTSPRGPKIQYSQVCYSSEAQETIQSLQTWRETPVVQLNRLSRAHNEDRVPATTMKLHDNRRGQTVTRIYLHTHWSSKMSTYSIWDTSNTAP